MKVNDRRRFDQQGNPKEEEMPPAEESAPTQTELSAVKAELEAARRRVNDLAWALQSEKTEREEFKARLTRERERLIDLEKANAAATLMDAVDEMDRMLKVAKAEDPMAQGVRMIRENIMSRLMQTGLERMAVVGARFDPNAHEAADMEVTPNPDDDQKVTEEVRAGYRLKDRVVRPARVKVARYIPPANA